jgi:hypothetical protein
MEPCFLDEEVMGEPMGHGSRAFVPDVNPIWTKEQTQDFLTIHLFFFLFCAQNMHIVRTKLRASLYKKMYVLIITRDPHM